MADKKVIKIVKKYLRVLRENGITDPKAILYGSFAKNKQGKYSDIDVIILSKDFDEEPFTMDSLLWRLTLKADPRIEPISAGEEEFEENNSSPILLTAKKEGIKVELN